MIFRYWIRKLNTINYCSTRVFLYSVTLLTPIYNNPMRYKTYLHGINCTIYLNADYNPVRTFFFNTIFVLSLILRSAIYEETYPFETANKAAFVLENICTHGQKHAVRNQAWYNILHDNRKVRIRSFISRECRKKKKKMLMAVQ